MGNLCHQLGGIVERKGALLAIMLRLRKSMRVGCWEMQGFCSRFTRWLCPLLISAAIIRMIKWKNKYLCNDWEKPISFAPMRNNAELCISYNKLALSTYILKFAYILSKCTYKFK